MVLVLMIDRPVTRLLALLANEWVTCLGSALGQLLIGLLWINKRLVSTVKKLVKFHHKPLY